MQLKIAAKKAVKNILKPIIYRFPPVFLNSAGLMLWFNALVETNGLEGDVLEVGSYLGGTAIMASNLLKQISSDRSYTVIDTFGGFVEEQFASELSLGGAASLRHHFSNNTESLARWVMNRHGGSDIKMVKGDFTTISDDRLPARISACLLDIDLAEPIYRSLIRIYDKLVPGGIVIVDDCDNDTLYKARLGYDRFIKESGLKSEIRFGKGIVSKPLEYEV
jgi:predicted O-methyltransferase YrrM